MIGYLAGTIIEKNHDSAIVEVMGVGYIVSLTASTLAKLQLGEMCKLHIYTHVREDCLDLYGFANGKEISLFKQLLGVSGIGPKTAALVLDRGEEKIKNAISKGDTGFFTQIPRLGTKNAQKIIIELKGKVDLSGNNVNEDLQDALLSMGFGRQEVSLAIESIPAELTRMEDQLKYALKQLGKI